MLFLVAQGLLREREYGELLADLLDTAIEGLGADRGFVVLPAEGAAGPSGAPAYRAAVARNYKAATAPQTFTFWPTISCAPPPSVTPGLCQE